MKLLSEQLRQRRHDDISMLGHSNIGMELIRDAEQLEEENETLKRENKGLMMAANSFLGLIDCLGGRGSLDDAGPDGKNLAELVD